jgi:hypothetical protein
MVDIMLNNMSIEIRLVETEDAPFIVELRNDPRLGRYLSKTSSSITEQEKWIIDYKEREALKEEFYFLISENGIKRGLYRLYNINKYSFTIGSWLFAKCEILNLPIFIDIIISDFGFDVLNIPILLFDVRKENKKVIHYHLLKRPLIYYEDNLNLYCLLKREKWEDTKGRVAHFFNISNNELNTMREILHQTIRIYDKIS